MIYGHSEDELYVNLFIPSVLQWGKGRVEQFTGFPYEEATTLRLSCGKAKEFTVKFRSPSVPSGKRPYTPAHGTSP